MSSERSQGNSQAMIQVESLGKQYRLGQFVGGGQMSTLRDAISHRARGAVRRFSNRGRLRIQKRDSIWALRDVSFELNEGEVLGIIGGNGAGKTTLLKILSRITEPTIGRVVLRGRVASLLEVGTGFHPELTGRENVFLNGVVLGMSRSEVKEKFEEIVDFAGVERFIDTPVKRYSSGMQLRLAFAVAAHLDPEILIIDEVLAVGDSSFQTKCLRKMESVSRDEGRTILFVSHNMGVIRTLCSRALLLEEGRLVGQGDLDELIARYLGTADDSTAATDLSIRTDRAGDGRARILRSRIFDLERRELSTVLSGQDFQIDLSHTAPDAKGRQQWALSLFNSRGEHVCHLDSEESGCHLPSLTESGTISVLLYRTPLPPGIYTGDVRLTIDGVVADYIQRAFSFRVEPGDFYGKGRVTPSHEELVYLDHSWKSLSGKPSDA